MREIAILSGNRYFPVCSRIDKFSRIGCPSNSDEAGSEEECLEFGDCCWDNTWKGVPQCFFSIGGEVYQVLHNYHL